MKYALIADAYEKIEATTKRLEMTDRLVELFRRTPPEVIGKVIYLTQGKLYPDLSESRSALRKNWQSARSPWQQVGELRKLRRTIEDQEISARP